MADLTGTAAGASSANLTPPTALPEEKREGSMGEHAVKIASPSSSAIEGRDSPKFVGPPASSSSQDPSIEAKGLRQHIDRDVSLEQTQGMSFSFTFSVNKKFYDVTLNEILSPALFPNTLSLGKKHYAIHANEAELLQILDTLNVFFPGAVTSSAPLPGRVARSEVDHEKLSRNLSEAPSPTSAVSVPSEAVAENDWMAADRLYLAGLRERYADAKKQRGEPVDEVMLSSLSEFQIEKQIREEKFDLPLRLSEPPNCFTFTQKSIEELTAFVHHPLSGFSGVITLKDKNGTYTVTSEGIDPSTPTPFSIHSVGKVFTGALAMCLLHDGSIKEENLTHRPVPLDPSVLARLPISLQRYLESENGPTLEELMTHKGRLGNFLPKYADTIINAVLSGSAPPSIKTPEDLLSFADERLSPRGEENYSNLGLLLVGLSLQSLTKKPFKELLQKYVLKEAHVACFSSEKPPNGRVNKEDPIEEHMCGSPAGGYWTTAEDLSRFGSWLASLCNDPTYSEYFKRFGTEFYRDGEIQHRGGCFSGSAYLSAFPEHGVVVSIVSDGGLNAAEVYATIRIYMLHLPVQG